MKRAVKKRRAPLTREAICRAAVEIVDREGLDALTMRGLGKALGVEAMSLYNHFQDKDALLDAVVVTVLDEMDEPRGRGNWRTQVTDSARAFRRVLAAHPNAVPIIATRMVTAGRGMVHIERSLELLDELGLSQLDRICAVDLVTTFVLGHALTQFGERGSSGEEILARNFRSLTQVPASQFPLVARIVPELSGFDFEHSFEFGLEAVLDGLERRGRRR